MAKQAEPRVVEVEERISAAPADLYAMVSDLPNMGRWSPENQGGRWVGGATGPAVGARFKGRNRSGWRRWSTRCEVIAADEGRRFAFDVSFFGAPIARWTYELEPDGDGTRVVERWEDRRWGAMRSGGKVIMGVPDRPGHNRAGMEATLAALKAAAEPG